ncbi:MAG: Asr1405/Asl0597 family protein [Microcoleus sp.]
MSPPYSANPNTSQIEDRLKIGVSVTHIVSVSRIDRWQIHHRLQELMIPCSCPEDGSLRVEIHDWIGALLLRSVVQQFVASRQEMVHWLERCWNVDRY